jgi:hypothetical protein
MMKTIGVIAERRWLIAGRPSSIVDRRANGKI